MNLWRDQEINFVHAIFVSDKFKVFFWNFVALDYRDDHWNLL
jgi:hypothetical protein